MLPRQEQIKRLAYLCDLQACRQEKRKSRINTVTKVFPTLSMYYLKT